MVRAKGSRGLRVDRPRVEDVDRESSERPKRLGVAWISIPFGLVVLVKVITAFNDSTIEGIRVLIVIGIVFSSLVVLSWSIVFFSVELPAQRRSRSLRRNFPHDSIYVARNVIGFTTGIVTAAPELRGTYRYEYYGLTTDDLGFVLWSGNPPVKAATVLWKQLRCGTAKKLTYLGRQRWQASFVTTSGYPLNLSLSRRWYRKGAFSEAEANIFVAQANQRISSQ